MSAISVSDLVNVSLAEGLFGNPVWGFFKQQVRRHCRSRGSSEKYHVGGEWIEVMEEEFNANYAESRATEIRRFMGDKKVYDFWIYEKRLKESGWPQKLAEMLKDYDPEKP